MHVLVVGDIGSDVTYHAGDEAMSAAAVAELRRRSADLDVVAVSGAPQATTQRYGWRAVPRLGFAGLATDELRDARLERIAQASAGQKNLPWDDPAWAVIEAIGGVDGVLIAGGGNLNSTWPEHVYERAAIAAISRELGRPLVVTGQTIGPHLTLRHGQLANAILTSAQLVGVREQESHAVCLALGVDPERLVLTVDDASFIDAAESDGPVREDYVSATFAASSGLVPRDDYVRHLARLVTHAHHVTGLPVVLTPHDGVLDGDTGDRALHDAVRAASPGDGVVSVALQPGVEPGSARGARLVLSTRYHPVVWAIGGGVPALAVGTDRYTTTKIKGALDLDGLGALCLSPASLISGLGLAALDDLWARRDAVSDHLRHVTQTQRLHAASWWDAVAAALGGGPATPPPPLTVPEPIEFAGWTATNEDLARWTSPLSTEIVGVRLSAETTAEHLGRATTRVGDLEAQVSALRGELDDAADEAALLRESVRAAHELTESVLADLVGQARSRPTVEALEGELARLRATRTFRYLAPFRRAWGAVLRRRQAHTN